MIDFDFSILTQNAGALAQGLAVTLLISLASVPIGLLAGLGLAIIRLRGAPWQRTIAVGYLELVRNVPFVIQAFLLYFALPFVGIRLDPLTAGTLALAAYAAAYFSEIVRGAIASIPAGQSEAALILGLSNAQMLRRVILPQIWILILPSSTSLTITLVKETAILSAITVPELSFVAQNVIGRTFSPVEIFSAIAVAYWGLTVMLSAAAMAVERRLKRHSPSNPPAQQFQPLTQEYSR